MNFTIKAARLAVLLASALALAAPAFAALSDSEEPGSVIVFPKFIQGSTALPESPGALFPITELKIGIVCPKGATCAQDEPVTIEFHWVCGTTEGATTTSFTCQETNFFVTATVFEKIVLTPNGESVGFYSTGGPNNILPTHFSPAANCPNGAGIWSDGWSIPPISSRSSLMG
jgi:hypothetical protein